MITIDEKKGEVIVREGGDIESYPINSPEAFKIISTAWLKCGWDTKYVYSFSWLGRPIIQLPEDMIRIQELIWTIKPDLIIETGVAHGGSLVYYASLMKAMDIQGKIIGVDIEIRPHNRRSIEKHILFPYIELIEGDSIKQETINRVSKHVMADQKVFVILDSCHTKEHVLAELEAYSSFVSMNSYIVATDGIMALVKGRERSHDDWEWNNPEQAAIEFVQKHKQFSITEPEFLFNEGRISERVTYWPNCYIRRDR